jgi:hypothetical protein
MLSFTVLLAVHAVAQYTPPLHKAPEAIWVWSEHCNGDLKLGVTVTLDRKVLYRGVLPVCHGSRDEENGKMSFHFTGNHFFQGIYHTNSTDSIEVDIWQAGGEPDAVILGISFSTKRKILLNTLHIAKMDFQTTSKLDKGLFITTHLLPVPVQ